MRTTDLRNYDRLLSFVSVHHMIRAEKLLGKDGVKTVAIPTPREINISCGQCLMFASADEKQVLSLLKDKSVTWSKLFSRDEKKRLYIKLKDYEGLL